MGKASAPASVTSDSQGGGLGQGLHARWPMLRSIRGGGLQRSTGGTSASTRPCSHRRRRVDRRAAYWLRDHDGRWWGHAESIAEEHRRRRAIVAAHHLEPLKPQPVEARLEDRWRRAKLLGWRTVVDERRQRCFSAVSMARGFVLGCRLEAPGFTGIGWFSVSGPGACRVVRVLVAPGSAWGSAPAGSARRGRCLECVGSRRAEPPPASLRLGHRRHPGL